MKIKPFTFTKYLGVLEQNLNPDSESEAAIKTTDILPWFVSEKTGIIKKLSQLVCTSDEPEFFHFQAELCDPRRWLYSDADNLGVWDSILTSAAYGSSTKKTEAIAKTIGESIERFCLYAFDRRYFLNDSYGNLLESAVDVVDLDKFASPSEEEMSNNPGGYIPLTTLSPDQPIDWVKGLSLQTRKEKLIPACFVYVSYRFNTPGELINYPISTGTACSRSPEKAAVKGILEVIERDAFMLTWLNYMEAPRIVGLEDGKDSELQASLKRFEKYSGDLQVYLLPTDLDAYVALALVIYANGDDHALTAGISASLNPEEAVTKAIQECAFVRQRLNEYSRTMSEEELKNLSGVHYATPESLEKVKFLLETKNSVSLASLPNLDTSSDSKNLQNLLSSLESRGLEAITLNIGLEAFEKLGFWVYKTIIPGMQPLSQNGYWFLGGQRIYTLPITLGYKVPKQLNLEPHLWA
ncbi:YcaO-like family protein [Halotia wernerae UHCC 0503]|nr:YcaO-like family protein [Halotia wernerae UHCC 0503]